MSKLYYIITLGCKVNQCESTAIGRRLDQYGWSLADPEKADVCVINTCAVTAKAAMQSRQAIRRAARTMPGAKIIVTGCYAQISPGRIASLEGVDKVVGHTFKHSIPELITESRQKAPAAEIIHDEVSQCRHFAPLPASAKGTRTRAFLKIQDGCSSFCTYCIVPYARGPSRSMVPNEVLQNLHVLAEDGIQEVVLTGIHLGQYGQDCSPVTSLTSLLDIIREEAPIERIRLSSIEPTEINELLLDKLTGLRTGKARLCRHLHIPLQSGDDSILNRMHRPYDRNLFEKLIITAKHRLPEAAIGVDVLVGFPGENDTAFNQTFELLEALPVSYLHVFPFSPRPGTPAWHFKDKVKPKLIKTRCRQLRELSNTKRRIFYESLLGKRLEVLIETTGDDTTGIARGLSDNYVQVSIEHGIGIETNTFVNVEITLVNDDLSVIGKPVQ